MTDEATSGKLHIDSDWKTEAAQEKERLASQEKMERGRGDAASPTADANFFELVNMLAMQAAISLGGMQGAAGEQIPPNPAAAKHCIDLLDVLKHKTEGNLTDEEKGALDAVLYELRGQYVQLVAPPPPPASGQAKQ